MPNIKPLKFSFVQCFSAKLNCHRITSPKWYVKYIYLFYQKLQLFKYITEFFFLSENITRSQWVQGPQKCSAPHGDFERFLAKLLLKTRLNPACLGNMAPIPHFWQLNLAFGMDFWKWHLSTRDTHGSIHVSPILFKSEQLANKKPVILLTSKGHFIQTLCLCVVSARLVCVWGGGGGGGMGRYKYHIRRFS